MENILGTLLALVGGAPLLCGMAVLVAGLFRRAKPGIERALGPHATLVTLD